MLIGTNMKVENESNVQPGPISATYTEQVMWRDADTGKSLAASDYFTPISSKSLDLLSSAVLRKFVVA
jgi:hypothetical protein